MRKQRVVLSVAAGLSLMTSAALAQCGCGTAQPSYAPVAPTYATYYAPTYCSRAPNVTYNATAAPQRAYYAPVAQPYTTYYTPMAQPYAVYYGSAGRSIYGTPKIYVPGEPVRNVLRAVTP